MCWDGLVDEKRGKRWRADVVCSEFRPMLRVSKAPARVLSSPFQVGCVCGGTKAPLGKNREHLTIHRRAVHEEE